MRNRPLTLTGGLALPAVLKQFIERQLLVWRLRLLIPVCLLAWMPPVRGDTIQNFVIQNSSDPSMPGGTFFGGGTYSGSFSVDTSLIPSTNSGIATVPLLTFNIMITVAPFIQADVSSANGGVGNLFVYPPTKTQTPFPQPGQLDDVSFFGDGIESFDLEMFAPVAGTFHGGLVGYAAVQDFGVNAFDISGSALVIDPAVVPMAAPEPNYGLLLAGGACLFAVLTKRRGLWRTRPITH